jgi:Uma2 family endonuclease
MSAKRLPGQMSLLSAAEFGARHNGDYVELIAGRVQEAHMPGLDHGVVSFQFAYALGAWAKAEKRGRVVINDTHIQTKWNPDTVRGPDVFFLSYQRLAANVRCAGVTPATPELVVEVRSPSNSWTDIFIKVEEYLHVGVLAVVVLDSETDTASVYRSGARQEIFTREQLLVIADVLPGFTVAVKELFSAE